MIHIEIQSSIDKQPTLIWHQAKSASPGFRCKMYPSLCYANQNLSHFHFNFQLPYILELASTKSYKFWQELAINLWAAVECTEQIIVSASIDQIDCLLIFSWWFYGYQVHIEVNILQRISDWYLINPGIVVYLAAGAIHPLAGKTQLKLYPTKQYLLWGTSANLQTAQGPWIGFLVTLNKKLLKTSISKRHVG